MTSDKVSVERAFKQGYGLQSSGWVMSDASSQNPVRDYFGFGDGPLEYCVFYKVGTGANIQVRVFYYPENSELIRQNYDGLIVGGAAISFPHSDLHAHEQKMLGLGFNSTNGVNEMDFKSPAGDIYTSAEIVFYAPDNVYLLGIRRPEIFVPVGPTDPQTGVAAPAYSARCVDNADDILEFLKKVMGHEVRRDITFPIGDSSAMLLPNGIQARFIQAFAPGSSTGYMVLMDYGKDNKPNAGSLGTPNRGITMWSYQTHNIDAVFARAIEHNVKILHAPSNHFSPFLNSRKTLLMEDPGGFMIEVFQI